MSKPRYSKLPLLCAALAVLCVSASMLPRAYVATAGALLPPQSVAAGVSRMWHLREWSSDPFIAQAKVANQLRSVGEATVVDEIRVEPAFAPAWLLLPAFLFAAFAWASRPRRTSSVPERRLVREAVMLAQRGHPAVLVESGGRFRVVLADAAADRAQLPVLAMLPGGAPVLARRA